VAYLNEKMIIDSCTKVFKGTLRFGQRSLVPSHETYPGSGIWTFFDEPPIVGCEFERYERPR
jgi:hypothetical protein